jgi:hypothetical protein
VSEFVEACRREWKRLRVPDAVANEMAADLEADLKEAEAEGASPEDVLGSSAFDPRSFAAAWAAERGVTQPLAIRVERAPMRARALVALGLSAVVAATGIALALLATPSGSARVALARPFAGVTVIRPFGIARAQVIAPGRPVRVPVLPRLRIRAFSAASARPFVVRVSARGADLRTVGVLLLIVGVGGLVFTSLYWSPWAGRNRGFYTT